MFPSSVKSVLRGLDTEHAFQAMQVSLACHLYARKGSGIEKHFLPCFRNKSDSVTNVPRERYVQLVLDNHGPHTESSLKGKSTLTSSEALMFLHTRSVFCEAVKERTFKVPQSCTNGTRIGRCRQLLTKAWRQLLVKARIFYMALRRRSIRTWGIVIKELDFSFVWRHRGFLNRWRSWPHTTLLWVASHHTPWWWWACVQPLRCEGWGCALCYLLHVRKIEISYSKLRVFIKPDEWLQLKSSSLKWNPLRCRPTGPPSSMTTAMKIVVLRPLRRKSLSLTRMVVQSDHPVLLIFSLSLHLLNRLWYIHRCHDRNLESSNIAYTKTGSHWSCGK